MSALGGLFLAAALAAPSDAVSPLPLQALVDDLTTRIQALGAERDDLIILTDYMADEGGHTAREVADAVARCHGRHLRNDLQYDFAARQAELRKRVLTGN